VRFRQQTDKNGLPRLRLATAYKIIISLFFPRVKRYIGLIAQQQDSIKLLQCSIIRDILWACVDRFKVLVANLLYIVYGVCSCLTHTPYKWGITFLARRGPFVYIFHVVLSSIVIYLPTTQANIHQTPIVYTTRPFLEVADLLAVCRLLQENQQSLTSPRRITRGTLLAPNPIFLRIYLSRSRRIF